LLISLKLANLGIPAYLCVMSLRKKTNKSDKVSISVVMKTKNCQQKVVKTIGSSFEAQEIELLVAEGHRFIDEHKALMFPNFD
jgi:hypothetical protein